MLQGRSFALPPGSPPRRFVRRGHVGVTEIDVDDTPLVIDALLLPSEQAPTHSSGSIYCQQGPELETFVITSEFSVIWATLCDFCSLAVAEGSRGMHCAQCQLDICRACFSLWKHEKL